MLRTTITLALVVLFCVMVTACTTGQEPVQQPQAPMSKWEALSAREWVASLQGVTMTIHRVIVAPQHITLLYSMELSTSMLGPDQMFAVTLPPETHLATEQQRMGLLRSIPIRSFANVNLGMAVFEPYAGGGETLTLTVHEIEIKKPGVSPMTVTNNWEIPLLRDRAPEASTLAIYNIPGLSEVQAGGIAIRNLGGGFTGDSPRGQVVSLGVKMGDTDAVYLLVTEAGDIEELSAEQYENILAYLGIQASPPKASEFPSASDREDWPVSEPTLPAP